MAEGIEHVCYWVHGWCPQWVSTGSIQATTAQSFQPQLQSLVERAVKLHCVQKVAAGRVEQSCREADAAPEYEKSII